jgi:hypothetical protein
MPINSIQSELSTIAGVPDSGMLASVVGTAQSFLPIMNSVAAATVTLTRKPAGSTAAVASGSVTFDLPGVYLVTVAVAGVSRSLTVCVWPTAAVGRVLDATGRVTSTQCFQGAMSDPQFSLAVAEASLESTPLTPDKYGAVWIGGRVANFAAYLP